jgi:hypothetical protein
VLDEFGVDVATMSWLLVYLRFGVGCLVVISCGGSTSFGVLGWICASKSHAMFSGSILLIVSSMLGIHMYLP